MSVTFFFCGKPAARPTCHRCKGTSVARCEGLKGDLSTCGAELCTEHRRDAAGSPRCATHAPNIVSATMPKPPGRSR